MGFSAGAELATAAAVLFEDFDKKNSDAGDPLAGITSRPDFVGIIYPGPSPFARNRTPPPIPRNVPPAFVVCGGSGDRVHAVWAIEYFSAMLADAVPNIEMHIYGNGRHPGGVLPDGSHMTGGLTDRMTHRLAPGNIASSTGSVISASCKSRASKPKPQATSPLL